MTAKPQGTSQRTSRSRIAAALCTAGVVAVAFSGNLLGTAAQDPPVPGEPVANGPSQVPPEPAPPPAPPPAPDPTPSTPAVQSAAAIRLRLVRCEVP